MSDYNFPAKCPDTNEVSNTFTLRLRGGGYPEPNLEMGIAAGGLIKQAILRDNYGPKIWEPEHGTIFDVQIMNSAQYQELTGYTAPRSAVTVQKYAEHGFPYSDIYNEKSSGISGTFADVKSVNKIDTEAGKAKETSEVSKSTNNDVVLLDDTGKQIGFRTVTQMEELRVRFRGLQLESTVAKESFASSSFSSC